MRLTTDDSEALVREGHVRVDSAAYKPGLSLEPGQMVSFRVVLPPPPDQV